VTEDNISPLPEENTFPDPSVTGREIAGELSDVAGWLTGGGLSAEQFRRTLITLEAKKVARFGFKLSSAISGGSVVHFSLRCAETGELCASMDVDVETGTVSLQSACS
jgi:hypothetical protein